jgi:glycosyltransferase involved in cell wall biosynthesis
MGSLKITVIVPARNAVSYLGRCLASIQLAIGRDTECIVVDDASADATAEIARASGATVVICPTRCGPAAARNLGAREATGDVLLFVDADCVLREHARTAIERAFADPEIDALVGAYDEDPDDRGVVSRFRNLLHAYTHRSAGSYGTTFWTGCGAVRREVFRKHDGFDESWQYMEDVEFGGRLCAAGRRVQFDATLQVRHLKRWTFLGMIRTDVFHRAVPWTRLLIRERRVPNELNLRVGQRASVLLAVVAAVLCAAAILEPLALALIVPALAGVLALNQGFYRFLARVESPMFAAASFPLHLVYFLAAASGCVLGGMLTLAASNRSGPLPESAADLASGKSPVRAYERSDLSSASLTFTKARSKAG